MNKIAKKAFIFIVICAIFITIDQLTKQLAANFLDGSSVTLIPGFLSLELIFNTGAAFGIFNGARVVFCIITILLCLFMTYIYFRLPDKTKRFIPIKIAITGVFCGAVGNLIDRIKLSYVIDFIAVDFGSYKYPRFNFADIYITLSAILLIFLLIFYYKDGEILSALKKEQ